MWFVVEKKTALPVVYEPGFATMEYGRRRIATWIKKLAQCQEKNEWPGYPAGINAIDISEWKFRQEEYEDGTAGSGF
jgi:hypothetical protein